MALVYRLNAIVQKGRLAATFLLHDVIHDKSFTIDSSFDANLPAGPWSFTTMAAAGDLLCLRGRHPMQQDVLMLCSPQQQAWKRLPLCNKVKHLARVGMSFHKDDNSYKVLAADLRGEKVVTEVFDSKLEAWSSGTQQEKPFDKLLGRCEFDRETQEFYHLVVKEELPDGDEEKVYSTIRYKEASGGWGILDMNLPARMCDFNCYDGHFEGYPDRQTVRYVRKASLVGNGNVLKPGLKLLVDTMSSSADLTFDFEQSDTLVYEYDKTSGKWQTTFLCSSANGVFSWKKKAINKKYRWFKEGSRWYPALIGTYGRKNAVRFDCVPGSDSESDIGSGEHVVPRILVPSFQLQTVETCGKRLPRRKLPRYRGDPRMKPSEEACTLMLESIEQHYCKRFGHGNKVFMVSENETCIVMYDVISHEFRVLHLSEPCILPEDDDDDDISRFANWDPVCVDLGACDSNVWKKHGFVVHESQWHGEIDNDNKVTGGNGLLVYDMTSMVTGDGSLVVSLMVHDVVEDKSGVIDLVYDARLQGVMWEVEIVAAAGCFLCFRCTHTTHEDMYMVCKPACNSWQLLPPMPMDSKPQRSWNVPTTIVRMYVDGTQASYKVRVSKGDKTVVFDSKACSWINERKGEQVRDFKFDNAFGSVLTVKDGCIAVYDAESCKWKPTGIELPKCSCSLLQLFGSQDRTLLAFGRRRCAVYGVNTRESRVEPILLNKSFLEDVGDVTGATILEELQETEIRELLLESDECFGRGDRMFWVKCEDERVVTHDFVTKQFKVLHIVKPWRKYGDGHRGVLSAEMPYGGLTWSCYTDSVYLFASS